MAKDYAEFLCEYRHDDGHAYSFTLKARDRADAVARMRRLSMGRVLGPIAFSAKIAPDWFCRLFQRRS